MSRKKMCFGIITAFLLAMGDFLYWSIPFSLGRAAPENDWNRAQLWYYDEHFDMREILIDGDAMQKIVTNIQGEQVTNRPRFRTMSQPYFQLYFYSEDSYPCSMTIVENGDISLIDDWVTDHRKYFDGGDELFTMLKGLMAQSPVAFPSVPSSLTP